MAGGGGALRPPSPNAFDRLQRDGRQRCYAGTLGKPQENKATRKWSPEPPSGSLSAAGGYLARFPPALKTRRVWVWLLAEGRKSKLRER
jgi:hypothetical protein